MTEKEFQQLRDEVGAYKREKDKVKDRIKQIEQEYKEGRRSAWSVEATANELYKELYDTPERQRFSELANKTVNDPEFEKYFRSAHSEHFFGKLLDPRAL